MPTAATADDRGARDAGRRAMRPIASHAMAPQASSKQHRVCQRRQHRGAPETVSELARPEDGVPDTSRSKRTDNPSTSPEVVAGIGDQGDRIRQKTEVALDQPRTNS